jgi:hypothetical protein
VKDANAPAQRVTSRSSVMGREGMQLQMPLKDRDELRDPMKDGL